jgi:hypothetical protein
MKLIFTSILILIISTTYAWEKQTQGNALNFGAGSYAAGEFNDLGFNSVTIETWFKWNPAGGNASAIEFICAKGFEQFELHTGGGAGPNGIRFIPTSGVWIDAENVLQLNEWTHIAAVYDPGNSYYKVYINGVDVALVLRGYNPVNTPLPNTPTTLHLGIRPGGYFPLNGTIDEFRIWNRVRDQNEIIADMYKNLNPVMQNGLQLYLDFNIGSAEGNNTGITSVPDLCGYSDLDLISFNLTGSNSNFVQGVTTFSVVPFAISAVIISFLLIAGFVVLRFRRQIV